MFRFISAPLFVFTLVLAGCVQIWNASDLVKWVEQQAQSAGCDPATIELADWYVAKEGANVWPGTCVNQQSGDRMTFEIGIDRIWTLSASQPAKVIDDGTISAEALRNAIYSGIYDEPITLNWFQGENYRTQPGVHVDSTLELV
jgi:hypothetical protein